MSIDLSPELSALSLHPATGPSSSLSSGSATPLTLRSSTGSGATTPPIVGEQHSNGLTVPAAVKESHESASPESGSYEGASPNGVDQVADKRRMPVDPTERRTIFIPNLPRDATLREMELLFHFFPGFIKVQMYDQARDKDVSQPVAGGVGMTYHGAFALFESPQQAVDARDRVQGMVFDKHAQPNPWVLQCKLAHKNVFDHEDAGHSSLKSSRRSSQSYNVIPQADLFQTPIHGQFSPLMSPLQQGGQYVQPGIQSGYGSPALGPFPHQLTPPAMQSGYFSDSAPAHSHQQNIQNVLSGMYNGGSMHNGNGMSHSGSFSNGFSNGWSPHRPNHGYHSHGHGPGHYSHAGPNNPPCTTLFLARLDHVSDEDLYNLLVNTFGPTLKDYKFMIDSRGQRIAFVEFDSIESASLAQPRISGYQGMTAAFSKNPLNKRLQ